MTNLLFTKKFVVFFFRPTLLKKQPGPFQTSLLGLKSRSKQLLKTIVCLLWLRFWLMETSSPKKSRLGQLPISPQVIMINYFCAHLVMLRKYRNVCSYLFSYKFRELMFQVYSNILTISSLPLFLPDLVMWHSYKGWFRPWPVGVGFRICKGK